MNNREIFLRHIGQTSAEPIGIEIATADGIYQTDVQGKKYIDLISGFSVCNIGHSHPKVLEAIQEQIKKYMHVIVYGEFIEAPQVQYARLLVQNLPANLNNVFFTNSGAEAVEGAMKLAKRYTNRSKIIAFNNSYHGSTQGAQSIMGDEYWRNAFRPLLPDIYHCNFNDEDVLELIDEKTCCVIMEIVQAEAGIIKANKEWIEKIRDKCSKTKTLLIFDEIQSGFGRTGSLWAFEQYDIVPDVLLLGKALGGGLPIGAFITDKNTMDAFIENPVLGHMSTFGGNPVSCAAGKAALEVLLENDWIKQVKRKEQIIKQKIVHPKIKNITTAGMWAAINFDSFEINKKVIHQCIENGLISDWFLFNPSSLRFAPPLIMTEEELVNVCNILLKSIDSVFETN